MNAKDKQDLDLVIYRLGEQDKKIAELKSCMDNAHAKTDESLKFIKENLFNPHQGVWAETKLNTQFRENTTRWRFPIGVGFVSLAVKHVWDLFKGS